MKARTSEDRRGKNEEGYDRRKRVQSAGKNGKGKERTEEEESVMRCEEGEERRGEGLMKKREEGEANKGKA